MSNIVIIALTKTNPHEPAFVVTARDKIALRAGTAVMIGDQSHQFDADTAIAFTPVKGGTDFVIRVLPDGTLQAADRRAESTAADGAVIGGFHFAPGGNAPARSGGDAIPAINPYSCWDINFRPACPDPRGMTLVDDRFGGKFWCDIYLTAAKHLRNGTSHFGAKIADDRDQPEKPGGDTYSDFNYHTAKAVMEHHGKGLLSTDEFIAAAFGVTEETSHKGDPIITDLDPERTSRWGVMQATGNMWTWGHDGDPDKPRASLFGGSWWSDGNAGSRHASVGHWPEDSLEGCGARGRSDHLVLV